MSNTLNEILLRVANRDRIEKEANQVPSPIHYDKKSIDKYASMQRGLADNQLLQYSQVNKDITLLDRTIYNMAKKILQLSGGNATLGDITTVKEHYVNEAYEATPDHLKPMPEIEPEEGEEPKGKKAGKVVTKPLEAEGQMSLLSQEAKAEKPADPKKLVSAGATSAPTTTGNTAEPSAAGKKAKKEVA